MFFCLPKYVFEKTIIVFFLFNFFSTNKIDRMSVVLGKIVDLGGILILNKKHI